MPKLASKNTTISLVFLAVVEALTQVIQLGRGLRSVH